MALKNRTKASWQGQALPMVEVPAFCKVRGAEDDDGNHDNNVLIITNISMAQDSTQTLNSGGYCNSWGQIPSARRAAPPIMAE